MFASSKQKWLSAKYHRTTNLTLCDRTVSHAIQTAEASNELVWASASAAFSMVIIDEEGARVSERNSMVSNLQGYFFPRINRCCHSAAKVAVHSCSCRIASAFVR